MKVADGLIRHASSRLPRNPRRRCRRKTHRSVPAEGDARCRRAHGTPRRAAALPIPTSRSPNWEFRSPCWARSGATALATSCSRTLETNGVGTSGLLVRRSSPPHPPRWWPSMPTESARFCTIRARTRRSRRGDVAWNLIDAAPILHVAGPFLMENFMGADKRRRPSKRRRRGAKSTKFGPIWDATGRWMSVLEPCLPYLDYALPSLEEARHLTGRHNARRHRPGFLGSRRAGRGYQDGQRGRVCQNGARAKSSRHRP